MSLTSKVAFEKRTTSIASKQDNMASYIEQHNFVKTFGKYLTVEPYINQA